MRPKHLCNHPGCRQLVDYAKTYCPKHEQQLNHARNKRDYAKRKDQYQMFYRSTGWKQLSRRYKQAYPYCEECYSRGVIRPAEICDHITPIKDDWSKRLNFNNLQSLCNECHEKKHDRFYRRTNI